MENNYTPTVVYEELGEFLYIPGTIDATSPPTNSLPQSQSLQEFSETASDPKQPLPENTDRGVEILGIDEAPPYIVPRNFASDETQVLPKNRDREVEILGVDEDSPYLVPLNLGWRRDVVFRAVTSNRQADIYYVPPKGKRCRSLKDVERAIMDTDLTLAHFAFVPKILGVNDPTKEFIRSAQESPFNRASLNLSQEAFNSPTKKAKVKPVNLASLLTDKTSLNVNSGLEVTEKDDLVVSSSISYELDSDPLASPPQVSLRSCSCGTCSSLDDKSVCCWEVSNVQVVKSDYQCITHHPGFEKLILDCDVLSITRHMLSIKTKNKTKKSLLNTENPLNITWRYIAYKQFVSWINVCTAVGSKSPVAVPSCVVNAVREKYPEQNGNSYRVLKFSVL